MQSPYPLLHPHQETKTTSKDNLTIKTAPRTLRKLRFVVQVLGDLECGNDVVVAQLGVLARGKQTRDLEDVLDLASIHVHARKFVEFLLGDAMLLRG